MALVKKVRPQRVLMGRLSSGEDLLGEITAVCTREKLTLGRIEAVGAVQRARLGYYNQLSREYRYFTVNEPLELCTLQGNVSLKEGEPFVHAHVTFSDEKGAAYGGHLAPGTIVFACEYLLEVYEGDELLREYDETTGLHLWREEGAEP